MARPTAIPKAGIRAGRAGWGCNTLGLHPVLNALPQRVVDNAQVRDRGGDDVVVLDIATHRSAGGGILGTCPAAPHQAADIELVAQQPVATLRPTADRRVIPDAATRTGNGLGVQLTGNAARAAAAGIGLEDAPHDGCLAVINSPQTAIDFTIIAQLADHLIAKGRRASAPAGPDAALESAPGLVGEVL